MSDPFNQPSGATPPNQPAYVDPVTGAPVYLDPATGQYVYAPGGQPTQGMPASGQPIPGAPPQPAPGQNPYMVNYGYAATPKTNGLAVASLIVAIGGSVLCGIVGAVVGAILGHVARRQVAQRGENGAGLALAAIIIGWSVTALAVVAIVIAIAVSNN